MPDGDAGIASTGSHALNVRVSAAASAEHTGGEIGTREPTSARSVAAHINTGIISTGDNAVNLLITGEASSGNTLAGLVERLVQAMADRQSPIDEVLAKKADQLATEVRGHLKHEQEQLRLWVPHPLPVHAQLLGGTAPRAAQGARTEAAGGGALELPGPIKQIGRRKEPPKPVWILGRAGSGKTVLAQHFALTRLTARQDGDKAAKRTPVPVVFSLGSWDPRKTSLRKQLIGQLERDHTFLAGTQPDGSTWATALVDTDLVLPVLDGFDEIAERLRERALEELDASMLPLLVTSRSDDLQAAMHAANASVPTEGILLTDLTRQDTLDYLLALAEVTLLDGTPTRAAAGWRSVVSELSEHPQKPECVNLLAALSTPLMVTLARVVYKSDRDPSELLNTTSFKNKRALEDHLLDRLVPTVYSRHARKGDSTEDRRWDPKRAEHWLHCLAAHLIELKTYDIEWWRLGTSMTLRSIMLMVGVTVGVASGLVAGLVYGSEAVLGLGFSSGLRVALVQGAGNGLGVGTAFGLVHGFATNLKVGGPAFEPSLMPLKIRGAPGRMRRLREGFPNRVGGGLGGGLLFGLLWALANAAYMAVLRYPGLIIAQVAPGELVAGVCLGGAIGLLAALGAGFETVIEEEERKEYARPTELLKMNRKTVLTQLFAVVIVIGVGYGIVFGLLNGVMQGIAAGSVAGIMVGLGIGSMTAWGRWVVLACLWLPLMGRLPREVNAFLDDAHQRGVLRQAGAVYQFRHAELRDRLGKSHPERDDEHRG